MSARLGSTSSSWRRVVIATDSAPRRDRTNASVRIALDHEVGEQVGGLGGGAAPGRRALLAGHLGERRLPQRQRALAPRRAVVGHRGDVEPGQPAARTPAGSATVAEASTNVGVGAVVRRHAAAAGAARAPRASRRRRGSGGTRRPRRRSARRGTVPSARGQAAASGAACPGWSAPTSRGRGPSRAPPGECRRRPARPAARAPRHRPRRARASWSCASALVGAM